jgi:hypothetical protein
MLPPNPLLGIRTGMSQGFKHEVSLAASGEETPVKEIGIGLRRVWLGALGILNKQFTNA